MFSYVESSSSWHKKNYVYISQVGIIVDRENMRYETKDSKGSLSAKHGYYSLSTAHGDYMVSDINKNM